MFHPQLEAVRHRRSNLEDAAYAAFAWSRFRRILGWMSLVALVAAIAAVLVLHVWLGSLSVHVAIAAALGVGLSVLLATALMGLMFLSSGSGHDEVVDDMNRDPDVDPDG